jgi:hypothetical protein
MNTKMVTEILNILSEQYRILATVINISLCTSNPVLTTVPKLAAINVTVLPLTLHTSVRT